MFTSLKKLYLSELQTETAKYPPAAEAIIGEQDIAGLPQPVAQYFRDCGFIGMNRMNYALISWKDVYLRFSPEQQWRSLDCFQFNAVPEPARIVYMKSSIAGIFPFEARDKFQDGHGNMLIRLLKWFTVGDAKGKEMDQSALVTLLAETMLVPSYALQHYIRWTSIGPHVAGVTIRYKDIVAAGRFYFNDSGEFIRFETNDRYKTASGSTYERCNWVITAGDYVRKDGIKFPTDLKALWRDEHGDFEYFKGKIEGIEYR